MKCKRCGHEQNVRYRQKRPRPNKVRHRAGNRKKHRPSEKNVERRTFERTDFTVICPGCGEYDERDCDAVP